MSKSDHQPQTSDKPPPTSDDKPLLPQGTYVIQIPKDQIYRFPPPENTQKMQKLSKQKPKRSPCCRCFCYTLAATFIIIILLAITTAVLYLVYRPEKLKYSVDNISIMGMNISSSSSSAMHPRLTLNIRYENPNKKLSVVYVGRGSLASVYYDDVKLADSGLVGFVQPGKNVTVVKTELSGEDIVLARDVHARMVRQEKGRRVPLKVKAKMPVKVKVGRVTTWEMVVIVKCDVAVDRFVQKSKIVSKSCGYRVDLW